MVLGIEASNILAGGGLVHLKEFLNHAKPEDHNFDSVILWAPQSTLDHMPNKEWLVKKSHPWLNRNFLFSTLWRILILPIGLNRMIDVLFVPGANVVNFTPMVTMCQNLLPFDSAERRLYGFSWMRLRLSFLHFTQKMSFGKARKVIFLTASSVHYVANSKSSLSEKSVVIPHGINSVYFKMPTVKNDNQTIKLLYVSIVDVYKHHCNLVEAVFALLEKGYDVELELVGAIYPPAYHALQKVLKTKPQFADRISYTALVSYYSLNEVYQSADIFIFASSCESFSLILLEAMASGLPIACSDKDTLKDTLQDAGVYFNPYDSKDIERVVLSLIQDKGLREDLSKRAFHRSTNYSWSKCSNHTLACLAEAVI